MLRFIANRLSTGISQLNSVTEMFSSHPISSGFVPGGLGESEIALARTTLESAYTLRR